MKKIFWKRTVFAALLTAAAVENVHAETSVPQGFGLGIVLGNPSGISASLPVGANNAFNVLLGYEFIGDLNVSILGDYVWHLRDLIQVEQGKVSLYYGPGVRFRLAGDPEAGIRVVLGIDYLFEGAPLQALFEIGPGVNVLPRTNPDATVGLGLRYYF